MCAPLLAAIPGAASLGGALGTSAAAGGLMILGTGLAAASSGLAFAGQSQAASSQQAAWNQVAEQTRLDLNLKYQQMQLREMEERAAFGQQAMEISRRTARAIGFTQAAAGEGGVYGTSIDVLLGDFGRQQSDALFALQRNAEMRSRQFGLESLGMQQSGVSSIYRSAPTSSQPSILSPIFQTLGTGLTLAASNLGPGFGTTTSASASASGPIIQSASPTGTWFGGLP